MTRFDPRAASAVRLARPTGALGFVCYSAYLTLQFTVLGLLERTDFTAAMTVFSVGVLLAALSAHTRLAAAGRFLAGAEAERGGLHHVSLQVLVVAAVLAAAALLGGTPADTSPAVAMGVTALVAGATRVATSVAAARSAG